MDDAVLNFFAGSLTLLNAILAVGMFFVANDLKPSDFKVLAKAPEPLIVCLLSQFALLPVLSLVLVVIAQPQALGVLGQLLRANGRYPERDRD